MQNGRSHRALQDLFTLQLPKGLFAVQQVGDPRPLVFAEHEDVCLAKKTPRKARVFLFGATAKAWNLVQNSELRHVFPRTCESVRVLCWVSLGLGWVIQKALGPNAPSSDLAQCLPQVCEELKLLLDHYENSSPGLEMLRSASSIEDQAGEMRRAQEDEKRRKGEMAFYNYGWFGGLLRLIFWLSAIIYNIVF